MEKQIPKQKPEDKIVPDLGSASTREIRQPNTIVINGKTIPVKDLTIADL